jgi:hypothetical protein
MPQPNNEIVIANRSEISASVTEFTTQLEQYLSTLNLPSQQVLVDCYERHKVIANIPDAISTLSQASRTTANYLSKFVAAVGAGLFDAALNFLWDETISNLREKVQQFDLDYFYDSVLTDPDRRKQFKTAEHLVELGDWELIKGCRDTGILSDIGFRHLDYVRNMRNWASAAHPNQNELTGLQLVSWLETCIREVIAKEPQGAVIHVKTLLHNVRTLVLTATDIPPIVSKIEMLPTDLALSLFRTIFGMFTDPAVAATTKNNIRFLAKAVWKQTPDSGKYEAGRRYEFFASNADVAKRDAARDFLDTVGGMAYLPEGQLAVELNEQINNLYSAHIGWNNFYNEPPYARTLFRSVPESGRIPKSVQPGYVKTLLMARVGNGYGIAQGAKSYYDQLISRFQESEIIETLLLLKDIEFTSRISGRSCASAFQSICTTLLPKTSKTALVNLLQIIIGYSVQQVQQIAFNTEIQQLLQQIT